MQTSRLPSCTSQLPLNVSRCLPCTLQLRESTRHLAPRLAALLLRLYPLAIAPITFWITVYMGWCPGLVLA